MNEYRIAMQAMVHAFAIAKRHQGHLNKSNILRKEDLSPVTFSDFTIQALINLSLIHAFPNDPLMGEESQFLEDAGTMKSQMHQELISIFPKISLEELTEAIERGNFEGGNQGRFWVIDPIDGTRGFIENQQYAIAIALIEEGIPVLSLLGCPRMFLKEGSQGAIFAAIKGYGCSLFPYDTLTPRKIYLAKTTLRERLAYCEPHAASLSHSHSKAFEIARALHICPSPFRVDSQVKYGQVAYGEMDLYLRIPKKHSHGEKIWDHAPGALVVEEAGGIVTDLNGKKLDFSLGKTLKRNFGIVASNGNFHEEIIAVSQKVLSDKN